ncbi:TPA_asm: P [Ipomoea betacytorhabdovirus 1]|nr:TPA_asm: P [Ipomoea betacytorhabdovirus 1]
MSNLRNYEVPENVQHDMPSVSELLEEMMNDPTVVNKKHSAVESPFEETNTSDDSAFQIPRQGDTSKQHREASDRSEASSKVPHKSDTQDDPDNGMEVSDVIVNLQALCKNSGIMPMPEYSDVLIKRMAATGRRFSMNDLELFVLGMETERKYNITTNLREIGTRLETSLKISSSLEREMRDSLARVREDTKFEIAETVRTAIEKYTPKEPVPQGGKSAGTPNEKGWTISELPASPSRKLSTEKLDFETALNYDVSRLPIPAKDPEFYNNVAEKLGWSRDMGDNVKFQLGFVKLPMSLKLLLAYDELSYDALKKTRELLLKIGKEMTS